MTIAEIIENNKVDELVKEMETEAFSEYDPEYGEYGPDLNDAWEELDEYED